VGCVVTVGVGVGERVAVGETITISVEAGLQPRAKSKIIWDSNKANLRIHTIGFVLIIFLPVVREFVVYILEL
jgi:hypothetical protein